MQKMHYLESEIRKLIREGNKRAYNGQLERLRFLLQVEGQEPFATSALAYEYYEEARLCWYVGAFVATIVMVQLAFEELLRSHCRDAKGVGGKLDCGIKVDQANFSNLIDEATSDGWISEKEAKLLHNFRKNLRNPYVHVKDTKGKPNLKKPDSLTQYLKIRALKVKWLSEVIGSDVENEAKEAIQLLVTLFPEMSRRCYGGL